MNGRIYDPLLGRFLSADLEVQFPGSLQSYNRYSYVRNNPLTSIDPSGFNEALIVEGGAGLLFAGAGLAIMASTPEGRQAAQQLSHATVQAFQQTKGDIEKRVSVAATVAVAGFAAWYKGHHEHRANSAAVTAPATGDKGTIANTVTPDTGKQATSTANATPTTTQQNEGFTASTPAAPSSTTTPASNPADTTTTTGSALPAANVTLKTDVHGNSDSSDKAQHGYVIRDTQNDNAVVKNGISGQALNQNETSPRANQQANAWNKEPGNAGRYVPEVVFQVAAGAGAREAAKVAEVAVSTQNRDTLDLNRHQKP